MPYNQPQLQPDPTSDDLILHHLESSADQLEEQQENHQPHHNNVKNINNSNDNVSNKKEKEGDGRDVGGIIWILKPSSKTNRGMGIKVTRGMEAALRIVNNNNRANTPSQPHANNKSTTTAATTATTTTTTASERGAKEGWIVQEYMTNPLLIMGRKFDLRCFVLLVLNKHTGLKAFFFNDSYARTSCRKFQLNNLMDKEIH